MEPPEMRSLDAQPSLDRRAREAAPHAAPHAARHGAASSGAVAGRVVWTPEMVRGLGLTTDLTTAAHILGMGRTTAFDLLRSGQFPVRVLRYGRRLVVPVPELLRLLGVSDGAGDAASSAEGRS